jgi:hypothetical protein
MGVSHVVLTLLDDPAFAPWLEQHGVVLPRPWPPSRYPTPAEIRAVLDQQPAYTVEYRSGPGLWDAWIDADDRQRTAIWVQDFSGGEDAPHTFFFHKGSEELNIQILEQLALVCGPFVLVSDAEVLPILVLGPGRVVYGQMPADAAETDLPPTS